MHDSFLLFIIKVVFLALRSKATRLPKASIAHWLEATEIAFWLAICGKLHTLVAHVERVKVGLILALVGMVTLVVLGSSFESLSTSLEKRKRKV